VLDEENGAQIRAFLVRHPEFAVTPPAKVAGVLSDRTGAFREAALLSAEGLLMTPRRTRTDGFFVSLLQHAG
jgi:16S rRNA (cytosine967-C5)-methyltransferase